MTGLLRRTTLLTIGAVLIAGVSMANVPSSTNSDQPGNPGDGPAVVKVVGWTNPPDPRGTITYRIMDGQPTPQPVPNSVVILNFTACADVRLCNAQTQGNVNCGAKTVTGVTNATGHVSFTIVGSGRPIAPTDNTACVVVTADGVPMNSLFGTTADYAPGDPGSSNAGVNALDGSQLAGDIFAASFRARSNHNGSTDSVVDGLDGSVWAGILFGNGSLNSCTTVTLCP